MKLGWLIALAFAVVVLTGCGGRARRATYDDGLTWLRSPYRVHAGDDPAWASPAVDDGAWPLVDGRLPPGTGVPDWNGTAWFRAWIDVAPEHAGRPVPMYGRYVGAAEVHLDGVRAFARGDVAAVQAGGTTPADFALDRPEWVTFAEPGRHLLAVRFASRHTAPLHRVGFPGGFELALGSRSAPAGRAVGELLDPTFVGAAGAFALLHLLLFLFHRDRRENLYYAVTALGVATITVFDGSMRWVATAPEAIFYSSALASAILLSSIALLRFYHAVFSSRLPRSFWLLFALAAGVAAVSWTVPRPVAYGVAGVVAVAQFKVLIAAVVRRASGAWIIGVGGALWLVGGAVQMLGDMRVAPRVEGAYLYGFLALLASMSIYLARGIANDKTSLARKLVEVSELGAKERHAMERYRTVFETTGTATITFGPADLISLANDEWAALTGFARQEIEGRLAWTEFFTEATRDKIGAKPIDKTVASYEAELRDRSGKVHEGVVTLSAVPGTGERIASFLDLTDLKRAQREMVRADKMAALGQLVAGVAHEINNPNNFIYFNLPILRRYVDAMRPLLERELDERPDLELLNMPYEVFLEDLFKLIDNMEHGSERITAIVSDLKHYIRSGEDAVMTIGAIGSVVERVMALVGKQVEKMVRRVTVDVAAGLPPVKMNAGKIEQVLINLLINAGQAADKADSWVTLTVRSSEAGDAVELVVADNGAGIPAETRAQIFEPFYTTKGRETGTGLGLAIAQQIVDEHGGRIDVTSDLGRGTSFTVRLPAVAAAPAT